MINFEKQTWYNKNDEDNKDKRIPISAMHLNRIEDALLPVVNHANDMTNHWWRRSEFVGGDVKTASADSDGIFYIWHTSSQTSTIYYSNKVNVLIDEDTGEVYAELESPTTWEVSYDSHGSSKTILKGKYFIFNNPSTLGGDKIYYSGGETARLSEGSDPYKYGLRFYGLREVLIKGFYEYLDCVASPNKDEYINGWNKDESLYFEYLGIPFDNARSPIKIETGSYIGTGVSDISLTFDGTPYLVFIEGSYLQLTLKRGSGGHTVLYKNSQEKVFCDWSTSNAVYCNFNSDLVGAFNAGGLTYQYTAIVI